MELWLQHQASAVLTALRHAQDLYGSTPQQPGSFTSRPDLEADLGGEVA